MQYYLQRGGFSLKKVFLYLRPHVPRMILGVTINSPERSWICFSRGFFPI